MFQTLSVVESVLREVSLWIQLTPTQAGDAREKYSAVAAWLERDPELQRLGFRLYLQGSAAIGTSVRPIGILEHDVDLVAEVEGAVPSASWLYGKILSRLEASEIYRPMLVRKNRCVSLDYAGAFHMDVLPARRRPGLNRPYGTSAVEIPDRQLGGWVPSNPLGFRAWFLGRADVLFLENLRKAEPLPHPEDVTEMAPLKLAVQLMKRRRDVMFQRNPEFAPRSIVLTTLAATVYTGQLDLLTALEETLDGITRMELRAHGAYLLPNPADPAENFADQWTARDYVELMRFAATFRDEVRALQTSTGLGLDGISGRLESMFGERAARAAFRNLGHKVRDARERGDLRVTRPGNLAVGLPGLTVTRHEFYGG